LRSRDVNDDDDDYYHVIVFVEADGQIAVVVDVVVVVVVDANRQIAVVVDVVVVVVLTDGQIAVGVYQTRMSARGVNRRRSVSRSSSTA